MQIGWNFRPVVVQVIKIVKGFWDESTFTDKTNFSTLVKVALFRYKFFILVEPPNFSPIIAQISSLNSKIQNLIAKFEFMQEISWCFGLWIGRTNKD